MLINASIIIKRRKNKQIRIESMAAFVFISGIHRTNGSDNEQLFGKSHSLFTAPKAKPSPRQARERQACGVSHAVPPPGPGMLRFVRPVPGSRYTMRRSSSWTMTCRLINFYNCTCTHFNVDLKSFSLWMCTVCFMYFLFLLFTAVLLTVRIWYVFVFDMPIGLYLFPLSIEHCLIFFIWTMKQLL